MLLSLLATTPPFRLVTSQLLAKMIAQLGDDPNSTRGLMTEHENILNRSLLESTANARNLLNCAVFEDTFLDIFDQEWKEFSRFAFNVNVRFSPLFLMYDYDMPNKSVAVSMRHPEGDEEIARRDLQRFFLLRKLKYCLCEEDYEETYDIESHPLKSFAPEKIVWTEGQSYQMDNRHFVRCYIREGRTEAIRYLAEDNDNFILVEPDRLKIHYAKVTHTKSLRQIDIRIDRDNPCVLIVTAAATPPVIMILVFEDNARCAWAYAKLNEHKTASKKAERQLVVDFLNNLESRLNL